MRTTGNLISLLQEKSSQIPQFIMSRLSDYGLQKFSPSHIEVLYYLIREGSLPMRIIAKRINKDKSTLTALVIKLESFDYVKRAPSPQDQRSVVLSLTTKGKELIPVVDEISKQLLQEFFEPFSKQELYTMHELISKIDLNSQKNEKVNPASGAKTAQKTQ